MANLMKTNAFRLFLSFAAKSYVPEEHLMFQHFPTRSDPALPVPSVLLLLSINQRCSDMSQSVSLCLLFQCQDFTKPPFFLLTQCFFFFFFFSGPNSCDSAAHHCVYTKHCFWLILEEVTHLKPAHSVSTSTCLHLLPVLIHFPGV